MTDLKLLLAALAIPALLGGVWLIVRVYYARQVGVSIGRILDWGATVFDPFARRAGRRLITVGFEVPSGDGSSAGGAAELAAHATVMHRRMLSCYASALGVFAVLRIAAFLYVGATSGAIAESMLTTPLAVGALLLAPAAILAMVSLPPGAWRHLPGIALYGLGALVALDYLDLGTMAEIQIYLAAASVMLVSRTIRPLAVIIVATVVAGGVFLYPGALAIHSVFYAFGLEYTPAPLFEAWQTSLSPAFALPWEFSYVLLAILAATPVARLLSGPPIRARRERVFLGVVFLIGVSLLLLGPGDSWMPLSLAMLGSAVALTLVWWTVDYCLRWNRSGYLTGLFVQAQIVVVPIAYLDGIVLLRSAGAIGSHAWTDHAIYGLIGASVVGYLLVLYLALLRARRVFPRSGRQLLLLRTFGNPGNARALLAGLENGWRRIGRVDLLAAGDIADLNLRAESMSFYTNESLAARAIRSVSDLHDRLRDIQLRGDLDLRFPVNEFLCAPQAWQDAVRELLPQADVVLMDLRGFTAANEGCAYELQLLLEQFPLERAVVLVDETTDKKALKAALLEGGVTATRPELDDIERSGTSAPPVEFARSSAARARLLHKALFRAAAHSR